MPPLSVLSPTPTESVRRSLRTPFLRILSPCLWLLLIVLVGCHESGQEEPPLFKVLSAEQTGIQFVNQLTPSPDLNIFKYMYFYNGGGVGAGDFNNDGLVDVVFTANQGPNKLYINRGQMRFEDVTAQTGFVSPLDGWSTGVSVVDINQDGLLDIYISQVGDFLKLKGRNLLFVCQGIENGLPVYKEQAADYGLNLVGFGTQAVFFDYDLDGDLDFFQLNHSVHDNGTFGRRQLFENTQHPLAGDRMFRNDNGRFVEVTTQAGIGSTALGYGLGVLAADLTLSGYPDLYVGNDFHENDYLYINQKNGRFRDEIEERIRHTSRFSMGVDAADLNNDGFPEIVSLDMLPYDREILKRSEGEDAYYNFDYKLKQGYNYQFARNNLQLNNQDGTFSEIGLFANVHATDWSWAVLLADLDNNGQKDMVISNGINKRMNDTDYINFVSNDEIQAKINRNEFDESDISLVDLLPEVKLPNQFFLNTPSMQFQNVTERVTGNLPSYSNGMIYADLDNDGDLDLVTNNINEAPFVYENLSNQLYPTHKSLTVTLKGPERNRSALGSKVIAFLPNQEVLIQEKWAVRGFQSSADTPLLLGLGERPQPDSLVVVWPDHTYERISYDSTQQAPLRLTYRAGLPKFDYQWLRKSRATPAFTDITEEAGLLVKHVENTFNEFDRESLIPHKTSTEGPALAVADINHDGLDDLFLGSSKWEKSRVFLQQPNGKFIEKKQPLLLADSTYEEVDAQWADLNGDGHLDLMVATGGNEFTGNSPWLWPRLYLNDGTGSLRPAENAFPESLRLTASCVVLFDANDDGKLDVFLGGRTLPWGYGQPADSYLLLNDGKGHFTDATTQLAPELQKVGMVKSALWGDFGRGPELVLALEWQGIVAFSKTNGVFTKRTLTDRHGWWNTLYAMDLDGDGDQDLLVGNLGLNSRYRASEEKPVRMYVHDYDANGRAEQILTYYVQNTETLFPDKREVERQLPYIKKKYVYARDFGKASLADIFGESIRDKATVWTADYFENALLLNSGTGDFTLQALPNSLQYAPYMAAHQLGQTAREGFLMVGNFHDANIQRGRYDASYGMWVRPNPATGQLEAQPLGWTGQFRKIRAIRIGGKACLLLARNNDFLKVVVTP